jgi:hypothetical protein
MIDRSPWLRAPRARLGTGMLELIFAIALLLVGLLGYSRALAETAELEDQYRETAIATDAARTVLEAINAAPFDEVYARFNSDTADNAGLSGPAPGNLFHVDGLRLVPGDADGNQGEIVFPTQDSGGALELREDLNLPDLGMPRDLNFDGNVDGNDHAGDYRLLPVLVRIQWQGGGRQRQLEIRSIVGVR